MSSVVLERHALGFPWVTVDPFLFCVHHDDAYPAGNAELGPAVPLEGRDLGQDFEGKDGWRMYHGEVVPGFPQHPHRGFETVTIVRRGLVDHADSLGAAARYGAGDVQWLTAGGGIVHSEMFPLVDPRAPNPLELFQIWLNLPAADKLAPPHFAMFWSDAVPRVAHDDAGRRSEVVVVAGAYREARPPSPPPRSWAARADSDVAIWTVRLDPGARVELPAARDDRTLRTLYFFRGERVRVGDAEVAEHGALRVRGEVPLALEAGGEAPVEILVLQGRPIGETVAAYGPFVMNDQAEIKQAFLDYQRTRFGGWPWPHAGPVHDAPDRFARHADGRVERRAR